MIPHAHIQWELLSAQYSSIRAEMIKRHEICSQLVTLTLVVAGTFLSVGVQTNVPESVLLVYPLLAMFLAAGWKQNDRRIGQMAQFIRDNIEKHIGPAPAELGWHTYRHEHYQPNRRRPLSSVSGVFVVTQLLAIALALVRLAPLIQSGRLNNLSVELAADAILFVVGLFSVPVTLFILRREYR